MQHACTTASSPVDAAVPVVNVAHSAMIYLQVMREQEEDAAAAQHVEAELRKKKAVHGLSKVC